MTKPPARPGAGRRKGGRDVPPSGGGGSGPAPRKPGAPARPCVQPGSEPERPGPFPDPGGQAPLQVSSRPGGRRLSQPRAVSRADGGCLLIYAGGCLPRCRRRAQSRTRSPPWIWGPQRLCTHTHTLAHDRSVVKGGPTPADLHPHTPHLGRGVTHSRSVSMEPPLRICKSKSEIKPPPTSSSSSSLSTSSSSLQPQQPQHQQRRQRQQQNLLPLKSDDP